MAEETDGLMTHDKRPRHGSRRRAGTASATDENGSRETILTAATHLMAERGFAATSIGSICTATGLAPTAIYWHFGSKDGLLAAIVQRSIERWYSELADAMRSERTGAGSRTEGADLPEMRRFLAVMADSYRRSPEALRLMLWLGLDRGHPDLAVRAAVQQARQQAVDRIAEGIVALLGAEPGSAALGEACRRLARLTLVQLDGIFVSHDVDDDLDRLDELFGLAGTALVAAGVEILGQALEVDQDAPAMPAAHPTESEDKDPEP